jgi:acetyl-CoA C-acetyltransferase
MNFALKRVKAYSSWRRILMKKTVFISAGRTAIGSFGGSLKHLQGEDMAAQVMKALVARAEIQADMVEDVYLGCCTHAENQNVLAPIIARLALLKAGLRQETTSMTLDCACCAGMRAVEAAHFAVQRGDCSIAFGGGVENMSRTPQVIRELRWGNRIGPVTIKDPLAGLGYEGFQKVAVDAGEVALQYGMGREEQDQWALKSQQRYYAALNKGYWEQEIIPLKVSTRQGAIYFQHDEFPRSDTTIEKLRSQPTVYGSPTVTAGNAPGLNDGAAGVLVAAAGRAQELGIEALAEIVATSSCAGSTRQIASIPAAAIEMVLKKARLTIDDMAIIEINEAFAAMIMTSLWLLAGQERKKWELLQEKCNVNGGSIAMGHPLGSSGCRIVQTMIWELRRRGGGYGVAAICGGLGQGTAMLIKV